ncbi:hypothetical protein JP56_15200, partial [Listeria monocytogenes]|nr:hypothetical protein [Listeria monocytogenes]
KKTFDFFISGLQSLYAKILPFSKEAKTMRYRKISFIKQATIMECYCSLYKLKLILILIFTW